MTRKEGRKEELFCSPSGRQSYELDSRMRSRSDGEREGAVSSRKVRGEQCLFLRAVETDEGRRAGDRQRQRHTVGHAANVSLAQNRMALNGRASNLRHVRSNRVGAVKDCDANGEDSLGGIDEAPHAASAGLASVGAHDG